MPISGNSFSFIGSLFEVAGTFTSSSTATGTYDYHDPYLGYSSGTWTANFLTDPYITLSPSAENFGNQTIGTNSSTVAFTVSNRGGSTATGSVSLEGTAADQFEITGGGGSFSIPRNQNKVIYVRFAPTSAGWKTATLLVDGNPPCNDESAALMGSGRNPMSLSVTPNYHILSASADSATFAVTNEGDGTMSWTAETNPDDTWLTITSGNSGSNSGTITVSYEANDADARIGPISVTADGTTNSPQTVQLLQAESIPKWSITASDKASNDYFGQAVCISGDQAIVGADGDDDNGSSSGSAYVFEKTESGWIQRAKLTASDGASNDRFGTSVSVSGDYVIIGAYADNDNGSDSGSAYIFMKPAGGWVDMTETAKLTASDGSAGDYFGASVGISGDQVVIGAFGDEDNGSYTGSAYIFKMPLGGWINMTETAKLTASDGASNDRFGRSVSISGDHVIISAHFDDDNGSDSGSAYIFKQPVDGWVNMTETAKLTANDWASNDSFGISVSMSGDHTIVGAFGDDDNGSSSGSAYVFKQTGSGWIQQAKLTASDGSSSDYFGVSVNISGDRAIVGGYTGSAYIFKKPVGGWADMTETAKVTGIQSVASYNRSVGISGNYAVVGDRKVGSTGYTAAGEAFIYYTDTVSIAVSDINDQITYENTTLDDIGCTIFDSKNPEKDLILTGTSSNSTLVPDENIVLGDTGVSRTITITPAQNQTGSTTISVTLSNGIDTVSDSFLLTVIVSPDTDGDGLPDNLENSHCTYSNDANSDDDGIIDGIEDRDHDGVLDPDETDPCDMDTDGDGVQDGTEMGYRSGHVTDTNPEIFQPDLDPLTTTDPLDADTDNDGLNDGEEDLNHNGKVDTGETDPCPPRASPWIPLLLLYGSD